jgi:hypothetical protein
MGSLFIPDRSLIDRKADYLKDSAILSDQLEKVLRGMDAPVFDAAEKLMGSSVIKSPASHQGNIQSIRSDHANS